MKRTCLSRLSSVHDGENWYSGGASRSSLWRWLSELSSLKDFSSCPPLLRRWSLAQRLFSSHGPRLLPTTRRRKFLAEHGLKVGDDVRHDQFGEGVILDLAGAGDKAEARVRFRDAGEKSLLLSWAPLQKL